jgi:copper transport protein
VRAAAARREHQRGVTLTAAPVRRWGPGRWISLLIAAMVCGIVVLVLVTDPPASRVLTSDPADGAVLDKAPAAVSITFSDEVTAADHHLSVVPRDGGRPVSRGAAQLTGTQLTVPLTLTREGDYTAVYHVVLGGGDVAAGSIRFSVGPQASGEAAAVATGHDHGSRDPWNLVLLAADLALVGAAVVLLCRRPRRLAAPRKPWRLDRDDPNLSG